MELINENTTRKIDGLGRVSIPKSMRDRLNLREGDEVSFFLLRDGNDSYVAIGTPSVDSKYMMAAEVLDELGLEIPDALMRMLDDIS
jgi:AbrB family looped-hinge helix DNA binding protein